jgi:putative ABC transport system substrate-binding protein
MRRRDFIKGIAGSATLPLAARAQQQAMPVVGYLRSSKRASLPQREIAFREGLASKGLVEGRNVAIDYQYAENQNDRLPALASELVRRQVDVIYAGENAAVLAAKAATKLIPIVFRIGGDPIQLGLVTSLNRPSGNITGVSFLSTVTGTARLQMLHEAVPNAVVVGLLVNPTNPNAEPDTREAQEAARKLGIDLHVVRASSAQAIDAAFATLVERRAQALVIDGDSFFTDRRQQLASLTTRHELPSIFATRDFPDAGGLMSYGASNVDADRLGGIYVGRILSGEKLADLPVQQSVKVELIINLITAKVLGMTLPVTLLGRADEVIE